MIRIFVRVSILIIGCQICTGYPMVDLKQGKVQGIYKKSYDSRIYSAFEGIPYAKPPIGQLRFKEPLPAGDWNGTLVANRSYTCSQIVPKGRNYIGSEDCLYINVYVPKQKIDKNDKYDVVVHIHGGSFKYGSSGTQALPDYVIDRDVIVVTFNYRLGAAGFLSTGDHIVPGNNGLKDQTLALKWIKKNILEFGGNPASVTLTGYSAGGESVQYHYLSPLSKGLFQRGFASSGVATLPDALIIEPLNAAKRLAQELNCTSSTREMVECLRNKPIEELVTTKVIFSPNVERNYSQAFLPENPYKMLKDKKVSDLPFVASNVIDEALFVLDSVYKNKSQIYTICNNWLEWGKFIIALDPKTVQDYVDPDKLNSTLEKIKNFYLNDCKLNETYGFEQLGKLLTDRYLMVGQDLSLRTQASATKSPVYYYLFKYIPEYRFQYSGPRVASHGVDEQLLFKFKRNPSRLQPEDEKMMRLFTGFLYEYAKTGIPKIGNITWIPIDSLQSTLNVLEINSPDDIQMVIKKELAPRKFWDSLSLKENNHLF